MKLLYFFADKSIFPRRFLFFLFYVFIIGLIASLLELFVLNTTLKIFSAVNPAASSLTIKLELVVFFCISVILSLLARINHIKTSTDFSKSYGSYISSLYFDKILATNSRTCSAFNRTNILNCFNLVDLLVGCIIYPSILGLQSAFQVVFVFCYLIYLEGLRVLFIISPIIIIYFFIALVIKPFQQKANNHVLSLKPTKISIINNMIDSKRNIYLANSFKQQLSIFSNVDESIRSYGSRLTVLSSTPRYIIESSMLIIFCILFYLLSLNSPYIDSRFISLLPVVLLALQRTIPLVQQIFVSSNLVRENQYVITSLSKEFGALNQDHANLQYSQSSGDLTYPEKQCLLEGDWKFHVSLFSKPDKHSNISSSYEVSDFYMSASETIVIQGPSGSGKSTFIDLIIAYLAPSSGTAIIQNKSSRFNFNFENLKDLNSYRSFIQSNFAFVDQSSCLVSGSILDNIFLYKRDLDQHDLRFAEYLLSIVELDDTVLSLPYGINTYITSERSCLSGGQTQRLLIARALATRPSVVIFDESTSGLNSDLESMIFKRIMNEFHNITIIFVSHKPTLPFVPSKVYSVNNGLLELSR